MDSIDVNTSANAIVLSMSMNDAKQTQEHNPSADDIASAVVTDLDMPIKTTNISLRATNIMVSVDDGIISLPLSPIYQQSSIRHELQDKTNFVPDISPQQSQNHLCLISG